MSVLPLDLFDPNEVGDLGDHAPDLGAVVLDHRVVESVQAEPPDRGLLVLRPAMVAWTMLIALPEPRDLDGMSLMPAASTTARTGPPAMTPVPGAAGLSSTTPAPSWPITACGIVVFMRGTR